ncbi:hypothetical protein B5F40_04270 [Gordonibacter sp. An230]|uniref:molybdopterin dinucleotide binding domain-containing protein n=1 Tax=Gordonibacter sp. An230 TaxID=1965592 RepID=UPI000B38FC29|nr:molybdopterin dinucleotide binding domain-containing protein [Gordonibacter sp. An230]OUO91326.1 hypothetical protein B5F40_04270 [Gordonibacter sp. An230]
MESVNLSRRSFVKATAAAGALSVMGVGLDHQSTAALASEADFPAPKQGQPVEATVDPKTGEVTVNDDVIIRYSTCLGCYCDCGNRVKMDRETGRVLSVAGNPYHPNCSYPVLHFEEPLEEAYRSMSYSSAKGQAMPGTMCARGMGTWDAYNQPDRITTPLKRAGARGEGKWKPISWEQLIQEVTEGGKLFAEIGEDRHIEGLKALHDNETPIDPQQPDLGAVSNQVLLMGGRADGRQAIWQRFGGAYGTTNVFGHSASCGGAQVAKNMSKIGGKGAISDVDFCEYLLWCGSFPGATGNSFQGMAKRSATRLAAGECTMDVLDPVLGNGNVTPTMKGINWIPIKTTTNAAFACAASQWIIDNEAYAEDYLTAPWIEPAWEAGYASFSNATHLVIVDESHPNHRRLMRPADAGLEEPAFEGKAADKPTYKVVIDAATGQPTVNTQCEKAELRFEGEVNGVKVRTAFSLFDESVHERSIEEYSEECGVPTSEIERIAKEFTSHGTKSSARLMGGSACVTGVDTTLAYRMLNALIGSDEMIGGCGPSNMGASTTADGKRYKLGTVEGKPDISKAQCIARNGKAWEKTDEYKNRVAAGEKDPKPMLPWFPVESSADSQALASIVNQYPYQAKIILNWMRTSLECIPGAMRSEVIDKLKDPEVVPLFISCDVVIGEDTQYADYVVPDTNPYESFGTLNMEGWVGYGDALRWRVKEPGSMKLDDGRYASIETFLVDVAKACDVPGFGDKAVQDAEGAWWPINDACDYFMKAFANLAFDGEPVADISEEDVRLQALDDLPEEWRQAVTEEEWPKVLNVISRGGRFHPVEDALDPESGRNAYIKRDSTAPFEALFYSEVRATRKNDYDGSYSSGTLSYTPQAFADKRLFTDVYSEEEFPFVSTNYKPRFRSISMLANSPLMRDLCEHNYIEINENDADELGIKDGDTVRVTNPTGDVMEGEAWVRGGVARRTFAVAYGYGHRAYGAQDVEIDGKLTKGDPAIGAGVHLDTMLDPTLGDDVVYPLNDNDSGTPGRSGGMYKIEKA